MRLVDLEVPFAFNKNVSSLRSVNYVTLNLRRKSSHTGLSGLTEPYYPYLILVSYLINVCLYSPSYMDMDGLVLFCFIQKARSTHDTLPTLCARIMSVENDSHSCT